MGGQASTACPTRGHTANSTTSGVLNVGSDSIDLFEKRVIRTFRLQTKRSNRLKFTLDGRLAPITGLDAGTLLVLQRTTRKELKRIDPGHRFDLTTLDLRTRIHTGAGPGGMAWAVR